MNRAVNELQEQYASTLRDYLTEDKETASQEAYELGREAITDGLGVLDITAIHHEALAAVLRDSYRPEESGRVVKEAAEFLMQSLAPFEMTHRGFQEANESLRSLNETLELRVAEQAEELRARVEAELQETHSILSAVTEGINDAVYIKDLEGRYVMINSAGARFLGKPVEEVIGRDDTELYSPDTARQIMENDRRVMTTGETQVLEEVGAAAGVTRTYLSTKGVQRDSQGTAVGVIGISHDITERKRVEEALERQAHLLDLTQDSIIVHDLDGRITFWNRGAEETYGWSREEAVGRISHELLKTRFSAPLEEIEAELLREGLWAGELVQAKRDGTAITMASRWALQSNAGNPVSVLESNNDITERKEAEARLREAEVKYRTVVEHIPAVTYIQEIDHDLSVTFVSPQIETILGYTPEEYASGSALWVGILHPEDRERVLDEDARTDESGEPFRVEYRMFAKDGHVAWIRDEAVLVRDEEGRPLFWQGFMLDITERREAEEALKESEERYRLVARATNEVIWDNDLTTGKQVWNGAIETMFGYSPEEVGDEARWWEEQIHPEDRERVISGVGSVLEGGGEGWSDEYRFRCADGGYSVVVDRAYVVRDARGEPVRMIGSMMDVTERKRAEEEIRQLNENLENRVEERTAQLEAVVTELRESEERYSLVVEGSNDGIFDWDIRTGELFWNDRFYEIVGLSPSEITPTFELFAELLHPEDRQRVLDAVTAHLERGAEYNVEFRLRHASGEYVYCISRGKAQREEDGTPYRMAGTVTDITERRKAEEAQRFLSEASAALSSSLDYRATLASVARLTVPDLADWCTVDILEDDGSLKRLAVTHRDDEKVRWARELQERYPADADARYGVAKVLRTGEPELVPEIPESLLEEAARDAEHREILGELGLRSYIAVPMIARGRALGVITLVSAESGRRYGDEDLALAEELARRAALAVDNTRLYEEARKELAERKRIEEEIRHLNESLERRVEERTAQLEEARKAADEANRAKSEFLSRMSHELRTPMNAILGFAQLLEMENLNLEDRESIEQILKAGRHLLALINEVLDIARIESGRLTLSMEPVLVQEVIQESLELVRPLAASRGIRLDDSLIETCERYILADWQRLKQVLLNLLSNAVKYNREGGVVTLSCEEAPRNRLRVRVSDTGPGLTPEQVGRLFTPFERLGAESTEVEGTGIGLALTKGLVELMEGEIGVESEVGLGSTFWVEFAQVESQIEQHEETNVEESWLPAQASVRTHSVLYIEDNPSNLKLVQRILSQQRPEIELIPAMQGQLGLDLAGEHRPDLILLDLQLPGITGDEVLRRLREDHKTREIPVVVLSADATPSQIERMLEAGAIAYLTKPINVREFLRTVDEVLVKEGA